MKNAKIAMMMSVFDPHRGSCSLGRVLLGRYTLYKLYKWLKYMKKKYEKEKMEEMHQRKLRVQKEVLDFFLEKEEEDARFLDRCEAKKKN